MIKFADNMMLTGITRREEASRHGVGWLLSAVLLAFTTWGVSVLSRASGPEN